jgi:hypothetical protein
MGLEYAPGTPPEIMPDGTQVPSAGLVSETELEGAESPEDKQGKRRNVALTRIAKARLPRK